MSMSMPPQDPEGFAFVALSSDQNLRTQSFRFRGRSKNCFSVAIRRLQKSWQYAYRDRRRKRREWSKFWIQRIQAGVRQYSWRYSEFMGCYKQSGMKLDRKVSFVCFVDEPKQLKVGWKYRILPLATAMVPLKCAVLNCPLFFAMSPLTALDSGWACCERAFCIPISGSSRWAYKKDIQLLEIAFFQIWKRTERRRIDDDWTEHGNLFLSPNSYYS